jgi:hypothetical protein
VRVDGARRPGTLVYSSWLAMRDGGLYDEAWHDPDPAPCAANDFALVRLDPHDIARTNPSVPVWGGPTGLATNLLATTDRVVSTATPLRAGVVGVTAGRAGLWAHEIYAYLPLEGARQLGAGFLDAHGQAVGVYSTEVVALRHVVCPVMVPYVADIVGDLATELAYLRVHSRLDPVLVPGTEPFRLSSQR